MSQKQQKLTVHVFGLPDYDVAFAQFVEATVFELTRLKNPFADWFPIVMSDDLASASSQVTSPSGEVVTADRRFHPYKFSMEFDDVLKGDSEGLIASLDAAADQQLSSIIPHLLEHLSHVTKAFGNNIEGQPLSHDLVNQMLDKIELSFDEQGNPIMPTYYMNSETKKRFKELPPPTAEQLETRRAIIERKHEESNAGKRQRQLP